MYPVVSISIALPIAAACWFLAAVSPEQRGFLPLLLPPPVAAFFVVLADLQGAPQPLALLDLGVGELVDLMHLEALLGRL